MASLKALAPPIHVDEQGGTYHPLHCSQADSHTLVRTDGDVDSAHPVGTIDSPVWSNAESHSVLPDRGPIEYDGPSEGPYWHVCGLIPGSVLKDVHKSAHANHGPLPHQGFPWP